MITPERLEALLANTPGQSIALVGDLFLDRYLHIEPGADDMPDAVTIAGFITNRIGSIPTVGESIEYSGYRFSVTRASHRGADLIEVVELPEDSENG